MKSLLAVVLAAAALGTAAAPPLSVPVPKPTPEQLALILAAEAEEMRQQAEWEEELRRAEETNPPAAYVPQSVSVEAPAVSEEPAVPSAAEAAEAMTSEAAERTETAEVSDAPGTTEHAEAPEPADAAEAPESAEAPVAREPPREFRRDPFWPVAVARARRAEHDARVAAAEEAAAKEAAIQAAREAIAARGEDPELFEIDESGTVLGPAGTVPASSGDGSFAGATEDEWAAAEAKIPPRSGYFGGKKPALVLKGRRGPLFVGDELCVTNRGVVYTWRVSEIDFRAYTHEIERVGARPVPKE